MADYTKQIRDAEDAVLELIKQGENYVVSTVSTWSEQVGEMLPELDIPFAHQIPDPVEMSNLYFRFFGELLKTEQNYTAELLKALSPVTGKFLPAARTVRKTATKAA
jgi:hypothetical protein